MRNRTFPYGYCCINGKITIHREEVTVVTEVYQTYLAGGSLLAIADMLNSRRTEYMPGVIGWNKARLKRILEDERYLGHGEYPRIIDEEIYQAIQSIKNDRSTQKETDRQADIYKLPVTVQCPVCGGRMRRIYNKRRKCKSLWSCEHCRLSIDKEDEDLLRDITEMLNGIIQDPGVVNIPTPRPVEPTKELRIIQNEIQYLLDSREIKKEVLRQKIMEAATLKYQQIDPVPQIAKKLVMVLTEAKPMTEFNAALVGKTVDGVILEADGSVRLILTNGQVIRKEENHGD